MATDFDGYAFFRTATPANPAAILASHAAAAQAAVGSSASSSFAEALVDIVGPDAFATACAAAQVNGTALHDELIACEVLTDSAYALALAAHLDIPCLLSGETVDVIEARTEPGDALREIVARIDGVTHHILDARCLPHETITWHATRLRQLACKPALAPRPVVDAIDERIHAAARLDEAVNGLRRRSASRSAASGWRWYQIVGPIFCLGLLLGGLMVLPEAALTAASLLMSLPFLCVTILRLHAFREVLASRKRRAEGRRRLDPSALPTYSVLVPLFQETEVLPDLVAALTALDYPCTKLEVMLLIEAADLAMQAALLTLSLPAHFRIVVVPDAQPRTKPKALNYGLQLARGDLVVVYDAEDRPHPQQLQRAAGLFASAPGRLVCVQAQLNIHNPRASWLTRQFTIEYSALFDAVLPALERLRLPVPLGGTSNHFRRRDIVEIGAWDPFNVTEDADLGVRLARAGRSTCIMPSTTWEEAPAQFRAWLPQRTRWLKGWMQTWLVHTRVAGALRADLGVVGCAGVHAILGGLVVSALVQPVFLALLAYQAATGTLLEPTDNILETLLISACWGNLAVGYAISILIGALSVAQRGRYWLIPWTLLMPMYWLLISLAAYRALYQLMTTPFVWEKTPHGAYRGARQR